MVQNESSGRNGNRFRWPKHQHPGGMVSCEGYLLAPSCFDLLLLVWH
jgi:hypothetical protein